MSSPPKLGTNTSPSTSVSAVQVILGNAIGVLFGLGVMFVIFTYLGAAIISGCPFRSPFSDAIRFILEKLWIIGMLCRPIIHLGDQCWVLDPPHFCALVYRFHCSCHKDMVAWYLVPIFFHRTHSSHHISGAAQGSSQTSKI